MKNFKYDFRNIVTRIKIVKVLQRAIFVDINIFCILFLLLYLYRKQQRLLLLYDQRLVLPMVNKIRRYFERQTV